VSEFKALNTLLGGYLHEDWADDYAHPWQAVDEFTQSQPEYAPAVRPEVDEVLRRCGSEPELTLQLRKCGLAYYPASDGWPSKRAWLLAVADRVDQTLRKSPAA
jgi:CdiI immunity protein